MDFASHTARIIARLGRPVVYTPQGGQAREVLAVFDAGYGLVGQALGVDSVRPNAICVASDVQGVRDRDTLGVDATTYRVSGVQPDGDGTVRLLLQRQGA